MMKTPLVTVLCLLASAAAPAIGALVYSQTFTSPSTGTTGTGLGDGTNIVSTSGTSQVYYNSGSFFNDWKALRLTSDGINNDTSNFYLPDFDPGAVVTSFSVTFNLLIHATALAGDEFSLNFGDFKNSTTPFNGIGLYSPPTNSGSMLSILWDTYDNGSDPNSIEVFYNGSSVANNTSTAPYVFTGPLMSGLTEFRSVSIAWDATDGLDVSYGGSTVFNNLAVPGFSPQAGYQFGFGAWTGGGAYQGTYIDNIVINTTASPVPEPSQIAASLLVLASIAAFACHKYRRSQKPATSPANHKALQIAAG